MKIKIAQTAGFCMGVRRAVDIAVDHASQHNGKVLTIGPLIHNNQTLETLRERGVEILKDNEKIPASTKILIRAHGIPPNLQKQFEGKGHIIIDGTCPKVKTVHKVIEKYKSLGYRIVITGDKGHAEVTGLLGYAGDAGILIQTPDDADSLPKIDKLCLVSQTTFDRRTFDSIAERLGEKFKDSDLVIKRTICSATDRRQEETRQMAKTVDAMIVVGGKNSANTLRLANISAECGTPTQHVETPEEINWDKIANANIIGITAGASTPSWIIKRVVEHIQFLSETKKWNFKTVFWKLAGLGVNLNLFVSAGAVCLYYFSCAILGHYFTWPEASIVFMYILSMYLWNSLMNADHMKHLGLNRYQFYRAHNKTVWTLALISIALLLWQSMLLSRNLFLLMLFLTSAGCIYHFTIVPPSLRKFIRYRTLRDIPTSRDLFVAIAWSVLITLISGTLHRNLFENTNTFPVFAWIFLLVFFRSVLLDLRDIEGDRIMGRETLVILIGEKKARSIVEIILWISLGCLILFSLTTAAALNNFLNTASVTLLLQTPAVIYSIILFRNSRKISLNRSSLFSLLADFQFFLSGAGAWIALNLL
jgi:4-hydroxy-3-methylbut-2-enyl diphosphate reductase